MAHKGLPNEKIRCVRTTHDGRSTSSHVRSDRLARTKMTIPFDFLATHGRSIDALHGDHELARDGDLGLGLAKPFALDELHARAFSADHSGTRVDRTPAASKR